MAEQKRVSPRLKLKDKNHNKIKKSLEQIILLHGGSFLDTYATGGKIKSKYSREVKSFGDKETKTLSFTTHWHGTTATHGRAKNAIRSDLNKYLTSLEITQHLPSFNLVNELVGDMNILRQKTEAWEDFNTALDDWETQMEDDLLKTFKGNNAGDTE